MESGEPGERAPVERDAPDDLRVTALDSAAPGGRRAGRAWRLGLRLGGVAALFVLIAVAAVALSPLLPRPAARKAPPLDITALQIPPDARSCVVGAAWSPDSAQVAIVRDSVCDATSARGTTPPTALIFDGATGRLRNWFPLDATILQSARATDQVALGGVAWTPDGQRIAVPFTVSPMSGSGAATLGMALLTVRGAQIGAFESWADNAPAPTPDNPLTQAGPHAVMVWDIRQGGHRALTTPLAYAYRWQADGSLEPVAPDGAASAPSGLVDGAILSGGFSLWRSARIWTVNALDCADGALEFLPRPYIALQLSSLVWSPDGRYMAQVSAAGRYDAPGGRATATPTPPPAYAPCSAGPAPNLLPLAPAHDAGLQAALALASPGVVSVDLEWRSDGKRLVALTFNPGGVGSAIALYDCRTGALIHRYTSGQFPINGSPGTGPAKNFNQVFMSGAWSPDGSRLLIEATGNGAVPFIMGPGALGT